MQRHKAVLVPILKQKKTAKKQANRCKITSESPRINPFACFIMHENTANFKSPSPQATRLPKLRAASPLSLSPPSSPKRSNTLSLKPFHFVSLKILPKHKSTYYEPSHTPKFADDSN